MNNIYKNLKPSLDFYFASSIPKYKSDYSLYHVVAYASKDNDYMIYIMPQNLYFFIEDGKLIYHPQEQRGAAIDEDYEIAYYNDKKIKHRKLEYLKTYVYTQRVYYKTFDSFRDSNTIINNFIDNMYKRTGLNKILKSFY